MSCAPFFFPALCGQAIPWIISAFAFRQESPHLCFTGRTIHFSYCTQWQGLCLEPWSVSFCRGCHRATIPSPMCCVDPRGWGGRTRLCPLGAWVCVAWNKPICRFILQSNWLARWTLQLDWQKKSCVHHSSENIKTWNVFFSHAFLRKKGICTSKFVDAFQKKHSLGFPCPWLQSVFPGFFLTFSTLWRLWALCSSFLALMLFLSCQLKNRRLWKMLLSRSSFLLFMHRIFCHVCFKTTALPRNIILSASLRWII